MAAVIGLRGMQRGDDFELATNVKGAGIFGNLVYTTNGRRYFLRLKHTDTPGTNKLRETELALILHKGFEGYKSMADTAWLKFIIYTNKEPGWRSTLLDLQIEAEVNTIFKTSDEGNIFKFNLNKEEKPDRSTGSRKSSSERKKSFNLGDPDEEMKDFLNKLIIFTGQKDQWELDDLIAEEIRNHDANKFYKPDYKSILHHFKTSLETWWRNKERKIMTPALLNMWLERAKTEYHSSLVTSLRNGYREQLGRTGINFSVSEISWLETKLSNKYAVHLRSDALTLCSILLLDCLPQTKCIFVNFENLQAYTGELLHAWLGGVWQWLIVSCDSAVQDSDISHTCQDIWEKHLKSVKSEKCLIVLTHCTPQKMKGFTPIDHKFNFEQLAPKSQEMVLEKEIEFQGYKMTMRSVLQRHGNVQYVLRPELVTAIGTGKSDVNIGGKLHENTDHYVPIVLKRKIWLPLNILEKRGTYPDVFAVSGIEEMQLVALVPSDEEVENFYFDEDPLTGNASQSCMFQNSRFIVLRGRNFKASFSKLQKNRCRETLHWLKYKDGKLLWKETRGDVRNLLDCIDSKETGIEKRILREFMTHGSCEVNEDSIWDLGERTVLVVAEPGMGKSKTTTQVARRTKERDPTSWVVRINWNDHTGKLKAINTEIFDLVSLVEFLCSAAFPESKYTVINRDLLKQALQSSGNVTVLIDGFDEISLQYAEKAAVILSELIKTNVGRLWVTSRPVVKETLEKVLRVTAFTLKKLSH
jgi:hypothetical protein